MSKVYKRNLPPKIIAILFSLLLWVYVMSAINPRITSDISNISIQLINLDEIRQQGLVIVGEPGYNVRVRLNGRRDEVQRITREQIVAKVDLKGYRVGTNNIPVEVFVDGQVDVDFTPKFITVELEEVVRRQKEVDIIIEGNPSEGYVVGQLEFKPTLVWVEGPESVVNQVNKVVGRLELENETENVVQSLALKAVTSRGVEVQNVNVQTQFADVVLTIDQLKKIEIVPKVTFNAAPGYIIKNTYLEPESIFVKGQGNLLANLVSINTEIRVINNVTENMQVTVPLELPDGITVFDTDTVKANVIVDRIVEKRYDYSKEEIVINNIQSGLVVDANSLPDSIEVKLVAGESTIQSIDGGGLRVILDVAGLQVGNHNVRPVVNVQNNLEKEIKEIVFNPQNINIKIMPRGTD